MATNLWANLPIQGASLFDAAGNPISSTGTSLNVNITGGTIVVSSGTVTANQGTPNTPANAWPVLVENVLVTVPYDYISATYPTGTQEIYVFKTGGSGGTTVATVTINYTDSTKITILNVTRT